MAITILISGCVLVVDPVSDKVRELSWLQDADPDTDLWIAIRHEDYRFMGVYGYSLSTPNVPHNCIPNREEQINPIEGTSDAQYGYDEAKLNSIARAYASDYNVLLLLYLMENDLTSCMPEREGAADP